MSDLNIDHRASAEETARRTIQLQSWRDLLFLHWPIPPEALRGLVPAPLCLDLYQGTAYVGVVAFAVTELRLPYAPRLLSLRFLETNVRTYVTLGGREPAIYFFSLDAASRVAVTVARIAFGLPYVHARMWLGRRGSTVEYRLRRSGEGRTVLSVNYQEGEDLGTSTPGSLQYFLLERYRFHLLRGGSVLTCPIRHASYQVRAARVIALEENLLVNDGLPPPSGPPPLVHYSPGVDVEILAPVRRDAAQYLRR